MSQTNATGLIFKHGRPWSWRLLSATLEFEATLIGRMKIPGTSGSLIAFLARDADHAMKHGKKWGWELAPRRFNSERPSWVGYLYLETCRW